MGYYIETPVTRGKARYLVENHDAHVTKPVFVNDDKILVCVVQNPMFDAAAIVYSPDELRAFNDPTDPRSKTWLLMSRTEVLNLNPHVKDMLDRFATKPITT